MSRPIQREWNHFARVELPRPFRSLGRPPVRGGRWSVRKYEGRPQTPWRAWTEGKARRCSAYFATHAEAFAWAQAIAEAYRSGVPQAAERMKAELVHERAMEFQRALRVLSGE